jgi:hypothetical protein
VCKFAWDASKKEHPNLQIIPKKMDFGLGFRSLLTLVRSNAEDQRPNPRIKNPELISFPLVLE